MTGPSNSPENDLSSALSRQAEQFARRGGHDLDLTQVVSRAGEIRRGRRMRATMVMAAVALAIAVPVGVTVVNDGPTRPEQLLPADQPDFSAITLDGLASGDRPAVGYAQAGRLQPGDLPNSLPAGQEPADLAAVGEDFLIGFQDDSGDLVARYVTADGVVGEDRPARYGFGVTADGSTAAIVQPDGTVVAYQDGGTQVVVGQVPAAGSFGVAGIRGNDCSPGGDCTVFVSTNDEDPKLWAVSPGISPNTIYRGLRGAVGLSAEYVAGYVSVSQTEAASCSEVRGLDAETLWKTCDRSLATFSPDGRHLLGRGPFLSGTGDGQLTVFEAATGEVVLDLTTEPDAVITAITWEGEDHVLATVLEKGTWALVRISLNGGREVALGPITAADDVRAPFLVAGQR